jgi:alpha-glucosidase
VTAADPWGLRLKSGKRLVLAEQRGGGAGPTGALGFRSLGTWHHARRIEASARRGRALVLRLGTDDPAHDLAVRISPGREGVIRLTAALRGDPTGVDAMGIAFRARKGERYLGFGERSDAVDQRGRVVENYTGEGAYQVEERPFVPDLFVPRWGIRTRDDATYFPMPWLLSTRGYGVLLDNPHTSYFRLGTETPGAWSVEAVGAPPDSAQALSAPPVTQLSLRFFAGPRPAGVLRRLTAAIGRQPAPAPWFLGPWFQRTGDDELADARLLRREDAPVSVYQTYLHYLPCGDQQGSEAEQPVRTAAMHALGYAVTTYFNPMICVNYSPAYGDAAAAGALTENLAGQPYVYKYLEFAVSQFDFATAAGRERYAALLAEAEGHGYDGWMEDFGEYTPLDSRSGNGELGYTMHNVYPRRYHCAAWEWSQGIGRPLARYVRSGWTGSARCSPIVWNGDPTTDWGYDGLRSAVQNGLSMGLSGVGIWGSDVGGFFALGTRNLTPELLTRWVQFGALSPVMRTQANGFALPAKERPQVTDPDQLANWRRYTRLHTQLFPYLRAAASAYRRTGMPIMRHLALSFPGQARAAGQETAYMFGPDLLAAPVLEPGSRERSLHLPRGLWIDFWRSVAYRASDGQLVLRAAGGVKGGRRVTLRARLPEIPLLARAGAMIPLLDPAVDTLSPYTRKGDGITGLGETDRLQLLAFPRGRSGGRFLTDGRLRSQETPQGWRLTISEKGGHRWRIQAALGGLRRPFRACAVTLNGRRLPREAWSVDRSPLLLDASFAARGRTVLEAERCGA